ncbi:MAG: DUF4340 domain-containing protein [Polyangia bacterium]
MKNRTVIAILAVAAALAAYILLFERDTMTTDERESRSDRAFVEFRREQVDRIELKSSSGRTLELERVSRAEEGEERWTLSSGERRLDADTTAVRSLLSAIDFLLVDRTVREPGAARSTRFGLEQPRLDAEFTARGETTSFRIGGEAEGGDVYLALEGRDDEIYAVEAEFLESMDKTFDELRDKDLVEPDLSDALAIEVERAEGKTSLRRADRDSPWRVRLDGTPVLADAGQAGELLRKLDGLRAESFVADGADEAELGEWGLGDSARRVALELSGEKSVAVRFGSPCEEPTGSVHVYLEGTRTVACAASEAIDVIDRPAGRLAEKRIAVFDKEEVRRIELAAGDRSLAIVHDEEGEGWHREGDAEETGLDAEAVESLLDALGETRADAVLVGEERLAELGEPEARATLELAAGQGSLELEVYRGEEGQAQRVRRGEEKAVLLVAGGLVERLRPDPLRYRERELELGSASDATRIEVVGSAEWSAEKKDGQWRVVAPIELDADSAAVRSAARKLARLEAERFAAASAAPEHGLDDPYLTATATFVEEQRDEEQLDRTEESARTLEIGAPAGEGGARYARLAGGDGAVFVLAAETIETLLSPPLARDLVQVEAAEVERIELARGDRTLAATRAGDSWKAAEGGPPLDAEALERAVTDVGSAKAIRTAAIGKRSAEELGEPRLELRLWTRGDLPDGEPTVLVFGKRSDDPAEEGRLARRSGIDATFVYPDRIAEELLELTETEKAPADAGAADMP